MTDEKPGVLDADPTELVEGAISGRAAAQELRAAVRRAAREGRSVGITAPDGRTITGGDDILGEAARLEKAALLDVALATALLLQDVCVRLDELRRTSEPPPQQPFASGSGPVIPREMLGLPPKFAGAADVNRAAYGDQVPYPHPGSATPEDAQPAPCPTTAYHPNHLWWGPPLPGVPQERFFCNGVRWTPPAEPVKLRPAVPPEAGQ
jgi:hypothetical protein